LSVNFDSLNRPQYGTNGKDWIDYKEVDGLPKLFRGNTDGDYVVRNDFDQVQILRHHNLQL
jgi:hypothetical protein